MNLKLCALMIGSSLAIGLGMGFGLAASDKPFVLEANNTPVGSFVLKCNFPPTEPVLPSTIEENERLTERNYTA
jgi:hypothetical protein